MEWTALIVLAILIETIVENIKIVWKENKEVNVTAIVVIVTAIVITTLTGADIFPIVNIPIKVPYVGSMLTGIIVSRGANLVNDLWNKLNLGEKK